MTLRLAFIVCIIHLYMYYSVCCLSIVVGGHGAVYDGMLHVGANKLEYIFTTHGWRGEDLWHTGVATRR